MHQQQMQQQQQQQAAADAAGGGSSRGLAGGAVDFVLAVGDDRSDEDMFTAIEQYADTPRHPAEVSLLLATCSYTSLSLIGFACSSSVCGVAAPLQLPWPPALSDMQYLPAVLLTRQLPYKPPPKQSFTSS
jgi:hypothetical protein